MIKIEPSEMILLDEDSDDLSFEEIPIQFNSPVAE
jgi:hypothetical protein